jgi:hypothetical protein
MPVENKHGKYDKFNLNKARWECPACGKDTLVIETRAVQSPYQFILTHSFKCEECEFDSLSYGFKMKKKDSFNAAHRNLMDMWFYLLVAEKKGWNEGFDMGMKIATNLACECND